MITDLPDTTIAKVSRALVTIRAEERLAFTVKRPESFVYGDLSTSLAA